MRFYRKNYLIELNDFVIVAIFLLAVLIWYTPSLLALLIIPIVTGSKASAAATSFSAIAALNFLTAFFTLERIAVFCLFSSAVIKTRFFWDLMLATIILLELSFSLKYSIIYKHAWQGFERNIL